SAELGRAAARLRGLGREAEAEILATSALMAQDPSLVTRARALAAGVSAAEAVICASEEHAAALAQLDEPLLAERAADIREVGRRAVRILSGAETCVASGADTILVARELGPGDVAELRLGGGAIVGIVLAEGSATSHAAILARSFGVPMVVGLGDELLDAPEGELLVVDGDKGTAILSPAPDTIAHARRASAQGAALRHALAGLRGLPPETMDGRRLALLCNAATTAEVAAGLEAGADGVGLLRTELAFLDADHWPTQAEHCAQLDGPLALLRDRIATVRVLDFGADKTPPFLAGAAARGLALLLSRPEALAAQLAAVTDSGARAGTRLRLLLPLVESAADVRRVRALLREAGGRPPQLGAMIETPAGARRAAEIALEADFISIGTNDLVATTLGLTRDLPVASALSAATPAVLRLVRDIVAAAHGAGLTVEVCGEAASEPAVAVLLLGLGVDELSVAPARVDLIRATLRSSLYDEAAAVATAALAARTVEEAVALADGLLRSAQPGDDRSETLDGRGSVLA
ncbi:MAG: phosphoenolpyruvate--protein phosphotransferase, partial [Actinobacteria bacterium]|nr:phosphoenolpyruvate--protein phosphotransferase [Actinomycetota bacterium]